MPENNRAGWGGIGFGSAKAGANDQGRQHVQGRRKKLRMKNISEFGNRNSEKIVD